MSLSRWLGFGLCFLVAAFFSAGTVWSHVGNTTMMGALVGDVYAFIWSLASIVMTMCAVAFVPGPRTNRVEAFLWLFISLGIAEIGYKGVQQGYADGGLGVIGLALMILALGITQITFSANPGPYDGDM